MNLIPSTFLIIRQSVTSCQKLLALPARCVCGKRKMSSSEDNGGQKDTNKDSTSIDDMSEPTNCCMSGCTNCVWIQYAEKLSNALENSDVDMQKVIMDKIQDPNMRAFLSMELRCRNLLK